jgi:hypothetical protein
MKMSDNKWEEKKHKPSLKFSKPLPLPCVRKSRLTDLEANNLIGKASSAGITLRRYLCHYCSKFHVTNFPIYELDVGEKKTKAQLALLEELKKQAEEEREKRIICGY